MISTVEQREAPADVESLCGLVEHCHEARTKLDIEGGGTLRGLGFPMQAPLVVETRKLNRILTFEPADMTASVQAGVTLAALDATLTKHGQFVPLDAPLRRKATVGGTLAAGWLGPRRHAFGRIRDVVIGTQVVLADGTLANAGGMVVKNVTGYDMSKLYIGSFGTLGIFTHANFKTLPRPAAARAFTAPLPDGTRSRAIAQLHALSPAPSAAFWIQGFAKQIDGANGPEGRLVALVEGSEALNERATRELRSAFGRAGVPETRVVDAGAFDMFQRVVDAYVANTGDRSVTYRLLGPSGLVGPCIEAIRELAESVGLKVETIADLMNGDVIARIRDRDAHLLAAKLEDFDDALHEKFPAAHVIAGDNPLRGALRVWGADPPALPQMRALKARFDPESILNAGRFVGGI